MDFFSVSLSIPRLQIEFGRPTDEITTAITLTLLFRSFGALLFGILSDRFGRKWPLVCNLLLVAILELGTGFVQTYHQFLALRSLFGIGMGGIWGLASATALENLPVELRGIASGIVQEGWAAGYLIPSVVNLFLVPEVPSTWRSLFYTCAGVSLFTAILRALLPESEIFLKAKKLEKMNGGPRSMREKTRLFLREIKQMVKNHWLLCGYAILLMAAFIPLWILPNSFSSLAAGAFWVQWGVQGALGVVPIQLAELSPPGFRATFPGVTYQLGAMISSASVQIEATGGQHLRTTTIEDGRAVNVPDYATVQGILIGAVVVFVILITIIGPENHGSRFEIHKIAFMEGVSQRDSADVHEQNLEGDADDKSSSSAEDTSHSKSEKSSA
ncbi:hypothetical protein CVT24_006886 [Panaeolus cyanescens]|uniref:Major facilitator superfamily (MFS) profile domain-containing protein n=1 Tax=Panaeolus cyanescens TaxID=181874 RepID=A0A409W039_9AGAR|nr:hypothetical protein CVT24_006886 [Panaeolus cyanescens]